MKKIMSMVFCLLLVLSFVGCGKQYVNPNTWDADGNNYDKIVIFDAGSNVEITDDVIINDVVDTILGKGYKAGKQFNDNGFVYIVEFYREGGVKPITVVTVLSEKSIAYEGKEYQLSLGDKIDIEYLTSLFNADTPNATIPSIVYNGELYHTTGKQVPAEVDESAIVGKVISVVPLSELPQEEGQSNFGEIDTPYAIISEGLVVKVNNEWTIFEKE